MITKEYRAKKIAKELYEAAEKHALDRRVAEFGPAGGNPNARDWQELEYRAARMIDDLLIMLHELGYGHRDN